MGVPLFGVDISGKIAAALGPRLRPATLIKRTPGSRGAVASSGMNPATASFAARGVVIDYDESRVDGTLIKRTDRKVLLLGDTIASRAEPEPDDEITIEGKTYVVIRATSDPAKAQWSCQVRQR